MKYDPLHASDDTAPTWEIACAGLSSAERERVESRLKRREYGPRTRIFNQGDKSDAMLIVETGRLQLIYTTPEGDDFINRVSMPGYLIGLISCILERPRILSAESVERTTVLELRRTDMLELMEAMPVFAINVARLLATMAAGSIVRCAPLALDSATVRLTKILFGLAAAESLNGTTVYVVRGFSQDDLAKMVGVSRPWITQTLAALEDQGVLTRRKNQITIFRIDAL